MSDPKQLESEALTVPEKARAIKVIDNETYQRAGDVLVEIKGLRREINLTFDPIIKKAFEAHREAKAQKTKVETPLVQAEGIIKPMLAAYDTAQENKRREEERRLQELARKQEEDRKLAEAVALESSGDKEGAEQVMAAPVEVAPVIIARTVPKVQGVSFKEVWKFLIVDAGKIPPAYLMPDEVKIGQVVRALKGATNIPGVKAFSEKVVTGRG